MKKIFTLTSATAFATFLALPFPAEITGSLSFLAGLALVLTADYGRYYRPLVRQPATRGSRETLRLAA